jgi:putative intracellular protease/amidase
MTRKHLLLVLAACFALGGSWLLAQSRRQVLLIARPYSDDIGLGITQEVRPMIARLQESGFDVKVASQSGALIGGGPGALQPDLKLSEVVTDEYTGILVPCMGVGNMPGWLPKEAVEIVKQAAHRGIPIAAQQSGVWILGEAGLLKGRKWACANPRNYGGKWEGLGVIQDGNILTSGICPYQAREGKGKDGTEELMTKFVAALKGTN